MSIGDARRPSDRQSLTPLRPSLVKPASLLRCMRTAAVYDRTTGQREIIWKESRSLQPSVSGGLCLVKRFTTETRGLARAAVAVVVQTVGNICPEIGCIITL